MIDLKNKQGPFYYVTEKGSKRISIAQPKSPKIKERERETEKKEGLLDKLTPHLFPI